MKGTVISLALRRFLRKHMRPSLLVPPRIRPSAVRIMSGPARGTWWHPRESNLSLWFGTYESRKANHLVRHLRRGMTFFDVGANAGYYTLLAARAVGPDGLVVAFEPLPENCGAWRRNVRANELPCRCTLIDAAVSTEDGVERFHASGRSRQQGRLSADGSLTVRTVSLDQLCSRTGILPDVVKIDVEGGELDVLKGAMDLLTSSQPDLFLALHAEDVATDCLTILSDAGYHSVVIELDEVGGWPSEVVAVRRGGVESARTHRCNVCASRGRA